MTLRALISDVHGNLPALEAVLREIDRTGADEILCAGDLVGYGPFPNECVARVAEAASVCVAGNHDLIALGRLSDERCIDLARRTLAWTRDVLSDEAREYLGSLPLRARHGEVEVAHGSLENPQEYVRKREQAQAQPFAPGVRVLVLGHTHRQAVWPVERGLVVNPGSVGQSRDLRARARFALLEGDGVSLREIAYDVGRCRAALRERGLSSSAHHPRPTPRRVARACLRPLRARA